MRKRCPKCRKYAEFAKSRSNSNGLQSHCKACQAAYMRGYRREHREAAKTYAAEWRKDHPGYAVEWQRANPDKMRAKDAKWYRANSEYKKKYAAKRYKLNPEYAAKWYKANADRLHKGQKEWAKLNPDKVRDKCARRRAIRKGATVEIVKREVVYERDKGVCHICGKKTSRNGWHLDHIIALSKGGEHSYRNVAVSHPQCNRQKGVA